ncbi:hypothetical protein B0T17DRAFT_612388 [Bombardia bombarda]|uniref:PAS domain-containing protein n=1 Tax=Bombardia bombarda TaxID=252184 RepID=A0AA39XK79_9PEZI|nr:hypothetical protein B0T17DRAFT_612388 [Bombardia bombarda]
MSQTTSKTTNSAASTQETNATSLSPLQARIGGDVDGLEPFNEEQVEPGSYDLLTPAPSRPHHQPYSLEKRSEQVFSKEHLAVIFADSSLLGPFTSFIQVSRPASIPLLSYYLNARKALKAVHYSNAVVAAALQSLHGHEFTNSPAPSVENPTLQEKANAAFAALVREDLPAFVTHTWIQTTSLSMKKRITGTLPAHLRQMSDGLAEVFCLTDPSRDDNPIVFASEEFYRTTQYGVSYAIGRNCRFLQGPKTNPASVGRLRRMLAEGASKGHHHYETLLNYRRDGSPFMNLLMCAPLLDNRGVTKYMIGAQVDVSGLAKDCAGLESLRRLVAREGEEEGEGGSESGGGDVGGSKVVSSFVNGGSGSSNSVQIEKEDVAAFREMSEMFSRTEIETVRNNGGNMYHRQQHHQQDEEPATVSNWPKPPLLVVSGEADASSSDHHHHNNSSAPSISTTDSGRLAGIYEHYVLVRPGPDLRILFASPSLRVPGILQTPLLSRIGGPGQVREELARAFRDGTVVTARIRWVSKLDREGRSRWIHCTPLLGSNGAVGVWMVVIVDGDEDEGEDGGQKRGSRNSRLAPPVESHVQRLAGERRGRSSVVYDGHTNCNFAALSSNKTTKMFAGVLRLVYRHRIGAHDVVVVQPDPAGFPSWFSDNNQTVDDEPEIGRLFPDEPPPLTESRSPEFAPGIPKPRGERYTRALVVARTSGEDVAWMDESLAITKAHSNDGDTERVVKDGDGKDDKEDHDKWTLYLYTTDNISAAGFHTPVNKGREAMAYLTYIIEHYAKLPDISVFMHSHRSSWHDNFFGLDTVQTLQRLKLDHVVRLGYFNLRCNWEPGCPDHIHPRDPVFDDDKPEQYYFASAWSDIFPMLEVPETLSQPCCAQFALTADRIRVWPQDEYIFLRDWMLMTELEDEISGRVFEYLYQLSVYIWTGKAVNCPEEHNCYCEGYGICFGGREQYGEVMGEMGKLYETQDKLKGFANNNAHGYDEADITAIVDRLERQQQQQQLQETTQDEDNYDDKDQSESPAAMFDQILDTSREIRRLEAWIAERVDRAKEEEKR